MDETIHSYMAGFLDGEGCITLIKGKPHRNNKSPTYDAKVFAVNTNLEVIMLLQKVYGGTIEKMSGRKTGWKVCYRWNAGAKRVESVLKLVVPYLVVKKAQGLLLLEFLEKRTLVHFPRGSVSKDELTLREAYFQRMWRLNHGDK